MFTEGSDDNLGHNLKLFDELPPLEPLETTEKDDKNQDVDDVVNMINEATLESANASPEDYNMLLDTPVMSPSDDTTLSPDSGYDEPLTLTIGQEDQFDEARDANNNNNRYDDISDDEANDTQVEPPPEPLYPHYVKIVTRLEACAAKRRLFIKTISAPMEDCERFEFGPVTVIEGIIHLKPSDKEDVDTLNQMRESERINKEECPRQGKTLQEIMQEAYDQIDLFTPASKNDYYVNFLERKTHKLTDDEVNDFLDCPPQDNIATRLVRKKAFEERDDEKHVTEEEDRIFEKLVSNVLNSDHKFVDVEKDITSQSGISLWTRIQLISLLRQSILLRLQQFTLTNHQIFSKTSWESYLTLQNQSRGRWRLIHSQMNLVGHQQRQRGWMNQATTLRIRGLRLRQL